MRTRLSTVALAAATLLGSAAVAAPVPAAKDAALASGDWRRAAELGATGADVVRALQARGEGSDLDPAECVVSIGPDNSVEAVALKPLPPLPADVADGNERTAGLSGSGFTFTTKAAIVLYPAYAVRTFEPQRRLRAP